MKAMFLGGCLLLFSVFSLAQRTDASRDARIGGTREGAIGRAQASQDSVSQSELKKLSKRTKTGTLQLRKEFHSAQQNITNLTFDRFKEIKVAAFDEQTQVADVVKEMKNTGEQNAVTAARQAKSKAQDKTK